MLPERKHLKILLVDDEPMIRDPMARLLSLSGFPRVTVATDGREGRECLEKWSYDLLVTDFEMPFIKGDELQMIARERQPSIQSIIVSGIITDDLDMILRERGARACFHKPLDLRKFMDEIESVYQEIAGEAVDSDEEDILPLAREWEKVDPFAEGHNRRLADLAMETALAMDLCLGRMIGVRIAGLCADIGKLRIDPGILAKETPLTDREFESIKLHPLHSLEIVEPFLRSRNSLKAIAEHHENVDGSGYPCGLAGDRIPLETQIVSIADSFDAMMSPRPFRKAMGREEAGNAIMVGKGRRWSPAVVDSFFERQ